MVYIEGFVLPESMPADSDSNSVSVYGLANLICKMRGNVSSHLKEGGVQRGMHLEI